MVKRGKVPKTTTSLSNKLLFKTSENLAKKGGAFFVRQRVTFVIFRRLCYSKIRDERVIRDTHANTCLAETGLGEIETGLGETETGLSF